MFSRKLTVGDCERRCSDAGDRHGDEERNDQLLRLQLQRATSCRLVLARVVTSAQPSLHLPKRPKLRLRRQFQSSERPELHR